jgi:pimeloyl-ACP methyl ester carboxylesterase
MKKETVVLLHGIGHSRWNMAGLEWTLQKAGYDTVNISYPSRKYDIQDLAAFVHDRLEKEGVWDSRNPVHFVTHSMGGLVTRCYLDSYKNNITSGQIGRVVMIAPPNGGSEVADLLQSFPPYRWLFGKAGQELSTAFQSAHAIQPYYALGIIAGTTGWPYILGSLTIKGKHDGRVSVDKTKLDGMKDHLTLAATHSFISWKPQVHRQIVHFLMHGEFCKKEQSTCRITNSPS